jgi:hypothetical protein
MKIDEQAVTRYRELHAKYTELNNYARDPRNETMVIFLEELNRLWAALSPEEQAEVLELGDL